MSLATLANQLDGHLDEARRWATLGEFTAARSHLRAAWIVLSELDGAVNHGAGLAELFTGIDRWRLQDDGAVADARAAISSGDLRQPESHPVTACTAASSPDVPRCDHMEHASCAGFGLVGRVNTYPYETWELCDVPPVCDDCGGAVRSGYFHSCGTDYSSVPPHTRHGQ